MELGWGWGGGWGWRWVDSPQPRHRPLHRPDALQTERIGPNRAALQANPTPETLSSACTKPYLLPLGDREEPHRIPQPELIQHGQRGRQLALAAVDQKHAGRRPRARAQVLAQRGRDGARVIRRRNSSDRVAAVLVERSHPERERRARPDCVSTVEVADVERLEAHRSVVQAQQARQAAEAICREHGPADSLAHRCTHLWRPRAAPCWTQRAIALHRVRDHGEHFSEHRLRQSCFAIGAAPQRREAGLEVRRRPAHRCVPGRKDERLHCSRNVTEVPRLLAGRDPSMAHRGRRSQRRMQEYSKAADALLPLADRSPVNHQSSRRVGGPLSQR